MKLFHFYYACLTFVLILCKWASFLINCLKSLLICIFIETVFSKSAVRNFSQTNSQTVSFLRAFLHTHKSNAHSQNAHTRTGEARISMVGRVNSSLALANLDN